MHRYLNTFLYVVTRVIFILLLDKYFQYAFFKLSLSSIVIPRRTTSWDFSILFLSRNWFTLKPKFVSNIMNWNLQGFDFNEFTLNHFKIYPKSKLRLTFPTRTYCFIMSKITYSRFWDKKRISLMKILNNKGPRIDPYGIAQITSQQSLKLRSFFLLCCRLLR